MPLLNLFRQAVAVGNPGRRLQYDDLRDRQAWQWHAAAAGAEKVAALNNGEHQCPAHTVACPC